MTHERLLHLASQLHAQPTVDGLELNAELLEQQQTHVLKIEVTDRQEFPIYLTVDEEQIICTSYLWQEQEVDPAQRVALLETMLAMNLPLPLSSFGLVGDHYVLFGALSAQADLSEICQEIATLSHNTLDAVETLQQFLQTQESC